MFKVLLMIKRKPTMSREDFIKYYEEIHAPLAKRVMPGLINYKRNFITCLHDAMGDELNTDEDYQQNTGDMLNYDCVTEFYFENAEAFQRCGEFVNSEAGKVLPNDEANFMDRDSLIWFIADEKATDFS